MQLRDYQQEALQAISNDFFADHRDRKAWRQLIVLPTGTGKTVLFAGLQQHDPIADWLQQFKRDQRKMLVIAHREELLDQAADKFQRTNPDLRIEIEQAERRASDLADVVIASVQTMAARAGKRMGKFDPDQFRIVVVDEAHHATAPTYQTILQYFGFIPDDTWMADTKPTGPNVTAEQRLLWQRERLTAWDAIANTDRLLLGVTATPKRGDNIGLEAIFQRIPFSKNMRSMIEAGYLCRLRAFRVESDISLDNVHTRAGDFDLGELSDTVNTDTRNRLAIDAWFKHAAHRKTVAFCVDVKHAHDLAEAFQAAGVKAVPISGNTPNDERRDILARFKHGKIPVLTNCNLLTEGFDEPDIGCILHTRPTKSSLLYIQMTGRGTRIAPDKPDCIIIDVVDMTRRHSLVTVPELFGLPPRFNTEGFDLLHTVQKVEEAKAKHDQVDFSGIESIADLNTRIKEVNIWTNVDCANIREFSQFAWIRDGDDKYRLPYPVPNPEWEREHLEIQEDALGQWAVTLLQGQRRVSLFAGLELQSAIVQAEDWLRQKRPRAVSCVNRDAKWRSDPMTPAQRAVIMRLNLPMDINSISKGQASMIISRYFENKSRQPYIKTKR